MTLSRSSDEAPKHRSLPTPFLMTSDPDCEYVPPEDFCLLLSSFDVSGLPKESDKGLGSATDADEISNDDGAVPEMPAFPSSLDAVGAISEDELDAGEADNSNSKAGNIVAVDSGSSLASATSTAVVVPSNSAAKSIETAAQANPKRRGRVSKRRKNAEERAAQIRARNRRAQQAFRKRQKVLSAERNDSLAKLEDEVSSLSEMNASLQQRVEDLERELEHERRFHSRVALPQPLSLLPHHISTSFDPLFESEHVDMGIPSNFIF